MLSAVFTWTNLLVVVVELDGNESEALDLVPLVTNTVLEEHQLIVGVVVVVDPGMIQQKAIIYVLLETAFRNESIALWSSQKIYYNFPIDINHFPFFY